METFELKIDFVRDSPNPGRVFRSMARLIESFEKMDHDILDSFGFTSSSQILLQDIEAGSIKAVLKWILELPDQEALRDGDWKKLIGRMLDDCRVFFLKKIENKPIINSKDQLEKIQKQIAATIQKFLNELLPNRNIIPLQRILNTIKTIESAIKELTNDDIVTYSSNQQIIAIPYNLAVDLDLENENSEQSLFNNRLRIILPVKKPDLMGDSQWELYFQNKVIRAKILDTLWLEEFHNHRIEIKPGDALDAELKTVVEESSSEHISPKHNILKVYNIVSRSEWIQD